jgi:hypothetical protein
MTDWNKEAEQPGTSHFWKPEKGQYRVKFLDEGKTPFDAIRRDIKKGIPTLSCRNPLILLEPAMGFEPATY